MSQTTVNSTPFIEATRYDSFILTNLHDGLLPDNMTRDVSNFGTGSTLNIKSVGTVTLQDVAEGVPMTYSPIDTGNVTLAITEYVGDAWSISDELRQEGSQIDQLQAARASESTRALQEKFETDFLAACEAASIAAHGDDSRGLINSQDHRFIGSGTNRTLEEIDLIKMGLAFTKANVPMAGRIAIVDPVTAAYMDTKVTLTNNIGGALADSPFYSIWSNSFMQNHRFVTNMHGWDIFTSNRLPVRTAATAGTMLQGDGSADNAEIGDVANIFMCIADDQCKPMMRAWRKMPSTEGWRAPEDREDRFQVTSKYGFGAQRVDSLGIVYTNPTALA